MKPLLEILKLNGLFKKIKETNKQTREFLKIYTFLGKSQYR